LGVDSFSLNLSDVTSKFRAFAMFYTEGRFIYELQSNRFHTHSPIGLLVIAIKQKAKKKSLWCCRYVTLRTELTTTPAKNCMSQVRTRNTC